MAERKPSFQSRIRARQEGTFVGRAEPLAQFEHNLALPVDDVRRRFVFSVHGAAGVGKTTLVGQWRKLAESRGCATGYVGTAQDLLSALEQLATTLAGSGAECPTFGKKLAQYKKDRRTVDADPNTPAGISSLMTRSTARILLRAAGDIPVVGAFTDEIDKDAAALQADQLRAFLARRFGRRHDLDLLVSPVDVLSQAIAADLRQVGRRRPLVLFFDAFEATAVFLNGWVLHLLDGRYGDLPEDIVLVLSGQEPLAAKLWTRYVGIRADIELQVFNPAEARELLAAEGIVDPATVDWILEVSGCLPVLVAMLAAAKRAGTARTPDSTDTAVEGFLEGVRDPDRQRAVLAASLCRRLDRETVAIATGATVDFDWLRRLRFVVAEPDGYYYHPVVRTMMIRSFRRSDPDKWPDRHRALADHYRRRHEGLGLRAGEQWTDERWLELKLEETYHDLCAAGTPALREAVHGLIDVYTPTGNSATRWARTIAKAGDDSNVEAVRVRGEELARRLAGEPGQVAMVLGQLAGDRTLDEHRRGNAWFQRSRLHLGLGDHAAALRDLDQADQFGVISLSKELRGQIHADLGEYDEALLHLDEAARLNPNYVMVFATRSEVHQDLGQFEAALADINRALELEPANTALIATRGMRYLDLDRTAEARADLDQAVAQAPTEPTWRLWRAMVFAADMRITDTLADLDSAVELDPGSDDARVLRAALRGIFGHPTDEPALDLDPGVEVELTFSRAMGQLLSGDPADGVPDLSRLIERYPDNPLLYYGRGSLFRSMKRYDDARRDLDLAIELDPDPTSALIERAELSADLEQFEAALADLDRALALEPQSVPLLTSRALMNHRAGRRAAALADLDRAAELDPEAGEVVTARQELGAGRTDPAETMRALDRAIARNPDDLPILLQRAEARLHRGQYTAALEDYDHILRILPNHHQVLVFRARALHRLGDIAGARRDFDRALETDGQHPAAIGMRARFLYQIGDYAAALADYTRAIELPPEKAYSWTGRGRVYLALGRYSEALADFERAAELDPTQAWAFYRQALCWWYLGSDDRVRPLLEAAVAAVVGRLSELTPLPDDVPGQLDALRGLGTKDGDRLDFALFATALGETRAAGRLLADVLAAGTAVDAIPDLIQELTELGRFVGADTVAPLLDQLTRR